MSYPLCFYCLTSAFSFSLNEMLMTMMTMTSNICCSVGHLSDVGDLYAGQYWPGGCPPVL